MSDSEERFFVPVLTRAYWIQAWKNAMAPKENALETSAETVCKNGGAA